MNKHHWVSFPSDLTSDEMDGGEKKRRVGLMVFFPVLYDGYLGAARILGSKRRMRNKKTNV